MKERMREVEAKAEEKIQKERAIVEKLKSKLKHMQQEVCKFYSSPGLYRASELNSSLFFLIWKTEIGFPLHYNVDSFCASEIAT
jgi:hypothetical protein